MAKRRRQEEDEANVFMQEVIQSVYSNTSRDTNAEQTVHQTTVHGEEELISADDNDDDDTGYEDELPIYLPPSDNKDDDVVEVTQLADGEYEARSVYMSESEKILALFLHQSRFKTFNIATEDIVQMFNDFSGGKMFTYSDWDTLKKKVPNAFLPIINKYFYANCGELVGPVVDLNQMATCKHGHESCRILPRTEMRSDCNTSSYFCYVTLDDWLRHQLPLVYDRLKLKKKKEATAKKDQQENKPQIGFYHDLSSCDLYQKLVTSKDGVEVLTLTLTWDGVAYTKDNQTMWPVVGYINELPFQYRINNPMVVAVHAGKSKPKSDIMLRPLVDELEEFDSKPLSITINGEDKKFYIRLLLFIADAPARAALLNCKGHTSKCGMYKLNGVATVKNTLLIGAL